MFIARTGNGTRGVVGLHGWSGDHTTFDPLLKVLPHDATFFTLDTPGCGQSPEPKKWEMRSMAREVAEEIVGFGQDNLTLVGSCSGALVAIFAVR
ncbi:MAG: alpha/beta hydrolase, partial [Verrucomicrobia bacterium]|nr:alpha/beta hydrolase [Verrucomicrobiota bacterium]